MTTEPPDGTQEQVSTKSGRYSFKSPGRVAAGKRLHEQGLAGIGGRRPTHGIRALAERLKRGLDPGSELALLHTELRSKYVADLGGEENISNMEVGICDRLADLDLARGLLNAQRETARRMTVTGLLNHVQAVTKNALAYIQAAKAIGPGRREKLADRTIIIKRHSDPAASVPPNAQAPDNGQGQTGGEHREQ